MSERVRFELGDSQKLAFADATFDRVHCSWLLEHVPDPVAALRSMLENRSVSGTAAINPSEPTSVRTISSAIKEKLMR